MAPEVIPESSVCAIGIARDRILRYPGIKEDVYAPSFRPDPSIKDRLGLNGNSLVVTIRPPATEAHYHNPKSEELLNAVFELVRDQPAIKAVLLPRTAKQEAELRAQWPDLFGEGKVIVPDHVVDGLDLIWFSDLVISGGGTMNREAAALGVPVYSIFRGKIGAVDQYLADAGRLTLLETPEDVRAKVKLAPRNTGVNPAVGERPALHVVVDNIVNVLESKC
jgi:predicted glycosyltransferase